MHGSLEREEQASMGLLRKLGERLGYEMNQRPDHRRTKATLAKKSRYHCSTTLSEPTLWLFHPGW